MWYKNVGRTFVRFVIIHAFDGQTDRCSVIGRPRLHSCSAIKMGGAFLLGGFAAYLDSALQQVAGTTDEWSETVQHVIL